uniref:VWFA domain-containing protein n=1 Tax=Strongyloides venezuelensis TaxID=75913 RepID=A0A0K0FAJ6_STRVS
MFLLIFLLLIYFSIPCITASNEKLDSSELENFNEKLYPTSCLYFKTNEINSDCKTDIIFAVDASNDVLFPFLFNLEINLIKDHLASNSLDYSKVSLAWYNENINMTKFNTFNTKDEFDSELSSIQLNNGSSLNLLLDNLNTLKPTDCDTISTYIFLSHLSGSEILKSINGSKILKDKGSLNFIILGNIINEDDFKDLNPSNIFYWDFSSECVSSIVSFFNSTLSCNGTCPPTTTKVTESSTTTLSTTPYSTTTTPLSSTKQSSLPSSTTSIIETTTTQVISPSECQDNIVIAVDASTDVLSSDQFEYQKNLVKYNITQNYTNFMLLSLAGYNSIVSSFFPYNSIGGRKALINDVDLIIQQGGSSLSTLMEKLNSLPLTSGNLQSTFIFISHVTVDEILKSQKYSTLLKNKGTLNFIILSNIISEDDLKDLDLSNVYTFYFLDSNVPTLTFWFNKSMACNNYIMPTSNHQTTTVTSEIGSTTQATITTNSSTTSSLTSTTSSVITSTLNSQTPETTTPYTTSTIVSSTNPCIEGYPEKICDGQIILAVDASNNLNTTLFKNEIDVIRNDITYGWNNFEKIALTWYNDKTTILTFRTIVNRKEFEIDLSVINQESGLSLTNLLSNLNNLKLPLSNTLSTFIFISSTTNDDIDNSVEYAKSLKNKGTLNFIVLGNNNQSMDLEEKLKPSNIFYYDFSMRNVTDLVKFFNDSMVCEVRCITSTISQSTISTTTNYESTTTFKHDTSTDIPSSTLSTIITTSIESTTISNTFSTTTVQSTSVDTTPILPLKPKCNNSVFFVIDHRQGITNNDFYDQVSKIKDITSNWDISINQASIDVNSKKEGQIFFGFPIQPKSDIKLMTNTKQWNCIIAYLGQNASDCQTFCDKSLTPIIFPSESSDQTMDKFLTGFSKGLQEELPSYNNFAIVLLTKTSTQDEIDKIVSAKSVIASLNYTVNFAVVKLSSTDNFNYSALTNFVFDFSDPNLQGDVTNAICP